MANKVEVKVDDAVEATMTLEKYFQITGSVISKYRKAYLIDYAKGSKRTSKDWETFLVKA